MQPLNMSYNYRSLKVYQKAECIYDVTYHFAHKYLDRGDRTIDQMIQAARSGKQNIAEGCADGVTSKEMELKLTNVARGSLQELLADYEDYLRARQLAQWQPGSDELRQARDVCRRHNDSQYYLERIEQRSDATVANIAIVLIHQTDYMLTKYIDHLRHRFLEQGGIKEEMHRARTAQRTTDRETIARLQQEITRLQTENSQLKEEIARLGRDRQV